MTGQSALSQGLEIAAAALGFVSSVVLTLTALRASSLSEFLKRIREAGPSDPGAVIAAALVARTERELNSVRILERRFLLLGAVLLTLSFFCSLLSYAV